jgi:hypothetical protein
MIGKIIYYINVQSPNLDLKRGIGSKNYKAGIFLSGKRVGEGGDRERLGK